MSRIPTPTSIDDAPKASQQLLEGVKKSLGRVPALFRITANSPAALRGYLELNGALGKGKLPAPTRERIALAVAEVNQCGYCLAAHTFLGTHVAQLSASEIAAARRGSSSDPKVAAALRFAVAVTDRRGHVTKQAVDEVKRAGYGDEEVVEIVAHVALNSLTNYINSALDTAIDFPDVTDVAV